MRDEQEAPTLFSDWFNPHDPEHMRAFIELQKTNRWPQGFVPDKYREWSYMHFPKIYQKMAEAWINHKKW